MKHSFSIYSLVLALFLSFPFYTFAQYPDPDPPINEPICVNVPCVPTEIHYVEVCGHSTWKGSEYFHFQITYTYLPGTTDQTPPPTMYALFRFWQSSTNPFSGPITLDPHPNLYPGVPGAISNGILMSADVTIGSNNELIYVYDFITSFSSSQLGCNFYVDVNYYESIPEDPEEPYVADSNIEQRLAIMNCQAGCESPNPNRQGKLNVKTDTHTFKNLGIFPNPVSDKTLINYDLNHAGQVEAELYATDGASIRRLFSEYQIVGYHQKRVDISDLPAGVYLLKLSVPSQSETLKLVKY